MTLKRICLLLGLSLCLSGPISARILVFDKYRCQCEVPDSWRLGPVQGNMLLTATCPTDHAALMLSAIPAPPWQTIQTGGFVMNQIYRYFQLGFSASSLSLHGQKFLLIKTEQIIQGYPVYINTLLILANGYNYLSTISKVGSDPALDPELVQVQQSFAFTVPPEIHYRSIETFSIWERITELVQLIREDRRPYFWITYVAEIGSMLFQALFLPALLIAGSLLALGQFYFFIKNRKPQSKP